MVDPGGSQNLQSEYDCPVCWELILPPIFQCYNGHLICGQCIDPIQMCPICRDVLPQKKIRNFRIEKIVREMERPCPFSKMGCTKVLKYTDGFEEHKTQCDFAPLNYCSLLGLKCNMDVSIGDLFKHYIKKGHGPGIESGDDRELKINCDSFRETENDGNGKRKGVTLIKSLGQTFLLKFIQDENENALSFTVFIFGSDKTASEFGAKIKLISSDPSIENDLTKFTALKWKGPVSSLSFTNPTSPEPDLWISYKHYPTLFFFEEDRRQLTWKILLKIYDTKKVKKSNTVTTSSSLVFHFGIYCSGCKDDTLLTGPRHKCVQCVNYDLCENCMRKKLHAEHLFVTIPHPNMTHQLQNVAGLR